MKRCEDCKFFEGFDNEDGSILCSYDGGVDSCPFSNVSKVQKNGIELKIDTGFMDDYIKHTIQNTISYEAKSIAEKHIQSFISEEIKGIVVNEIKEQAARLVADEIESFWREDIVVGGGFFDGPARTISRRQLLMETVQKQLKEKCDAKGVVETAKAIATKAIDSFELDVKYKINNGIKRYFDEVTKQTLTENVVSMLMCNDTYRKLNESMSSFLPDKR